MEPQAPQLPNDPPDITDLFKQSQSRQIATLLQMRPHPGAFVEGTNKQNLDQGSSDLDRKTRAQNVDTRGLDILLILLRTLGAFGCHISLEDDDDTPVSPVERAIWTAAWRNLGWDREADWELKRCLLQLLGPNPESAIHHGWTFKNLWDSGFLQSTFWYNKDFTYISRDVFKKTTNEGSDWIHEQLPSRSLTLYVQTTSSWHGGAWKDYLDQKWARQFEGQNETQMVSSRTPFLQIQYSPLNNNFKTIFELRVLKFHAPEAHAKGNDWVFDRQEAQYNLIAVIRLATDDHPDDIRTYWKTGREIVPPEIGEFFKDKDYGALDRPWTVESNSKFMLYYYRVNGGNGWPDSEIDINAEEFEERTWVRRESYVPQSPALSQETSMASQSTPRKRKSSDRSVASSAATNNIRPGSSQLGPSNIQDGKRRSGRLASQSSQTSGGPRSPYRGSRPSQGSPLRQSTGEDWAGGEGAGKGTVAGDKE
jgi:hypothetical protein